MRVSRDEMIRENRTLLDAAHGPAAADAILDALDEVRPGLGDDALEAGLAEAHPGGTTEHGRRLATIAALTALGADPEALAAEVRAALDGGARPEDVLEAIVGTTAAAGPGRAAEGLRVARSVLAGRPITS